MGPSAIVLYACAAVFLALFTVMVTYLLVRISKRYQHSSSVIIKPLPFYDSQTQEMLRSGFSYTLAKAE